ncbi:MAG TPA: O-antigen ligase family protein, partial [Patescibacteria group bacterium]|nr:O-antigen ligase family protein [Patescibacteria group bacterium]
TALTSAVVVSLYGILQRLGIDQGKWVQDSQARVFSTFGQPNWLATYLLFFLPLSLGLFLKKKQIRNSLSLLLLGIFGIIYSAFLFTFSLSAFFALLITLCVFLLTLYIKLPLSHSSLRLNLLKNYGSKLLVSFLLLILVTAVLGKPLWSRVINQARNLPASQPATEIVATPAVTPVAGTEETGKIRTIVWQGAFSIARAYPLFGSGVETFAESYYQFRPIAHNLTTEWDFLYNKAHNEYLNYLATMGISGFFSYCLFLFSYAFIVLKHMRETEINHDNLILFAVFAGWTGAMIANFFGFSVVVVSFLTFLFPALSLSITEDTSLVSNTIKTNKSVKGTTYPLFPFLASLVIAGSFLLESFVIRYYLGDVAFAKGFRLEQAGYFEEARVFLKQATRLNPLEPFYENELAYTSAVLAATAFNADNTSFAQELMIEADAANKKSLTISPKNVGFLKKATRTYAQLSAVDPTYAGKAFETLTKAAQLAPTDAKIHYHLSLLYIQAKFLKEAEDLLSYTLYLKPDYKEAYLTLTDLYIEEQKNEEAGKLLQQMLVVFPEDPDAIQKLKTIQNK